MTTVHESADYTFRLICERHWDDEENGDDNAPVGYFYKLTVPQDEVTDFLTEFEGTDGFDGDLFVRVLKDGRFFVILVDSFGMWHVEQFPTFAERDQMWDHLSDQYTEWIEDAS